MLIPRLKNWVATYYPGTRIGITEYNWGAEGHINGATAQADILGIFGREGLDLATRWTTPATGTPCYNAIKMYRNYDGRFATFGDVSVRTMAPAPDTLSAFAAVRSSDGALTLMVINKQSNVGANLSVNLTNFSAAISSQVWQMTSSNVIARLPDVNLTGDMLATSVPPQSITLFVVPMAAGGLAIPTLQATPNGSANKFDLRINGQAGRSYLLQATTNFVQWSALQTNTLASNSWHSVLAAPAQGMFYRVQELP
jgi:hypothetical protein